MVRIQAGFSKRFNSRLSNPNKVVYRWSQLGARAALQPRQPPSKLRFVYIVTCVLTSFPSLQAAQSRFVCGVPATPRLGVPWVKLGPPAAVVPYTATLLTTAHISAPSPGLLTFEMALDAPVVLSGLQAASAVRVCAPVDLEAPDGWTRLLASVAQSLGTAALTQPGLCGWTPAASLAWQPQRSRLAGALITSSSSTGDSLTSLAHSRRRPEPSRDIRHRVAAAEGCVCGRVGGCCHPLF